MTVKDLRIVHLPGSLVGYEPQFVAIFLNRAHDGCQPSPRDRLGLRGAWLVASGERAAMLRAKQRVKMANKRFSCKKPPFQTINTSTLCKPGRRTQPPSRANSPHSPTLLLERRSCGRSS